MVMWEDVGSARILRAGRGDWYNQSQDVRLDAGEDVRPLLPPDWQIALERLCRQAPPVGARIVVDLTQMRWLVGQEWGFLLRTAELLDERGIELTIVVHDAVFAASTTLHLRDRLHVVRSWEGVPPGTVESAE